MRKFLQAPLPRLWHPTLFVVSVALLVGTAASQTMAGGAVVHADSAAPERVHANLPVPPQGVDPAQRRHALREALFAQRERQSSPDAAPRQRRQLTPEERIELRQQIRQQRKESLLQDAQDRPNPKP